MIQIVILKCAIIHQKQESRIG